MASDDEAAVEDGGGSGELTAAQRARIERQRQRARTLRDARPQVAAGGAAVRPAAAAAAAGGGGFLPEEAAPAPTRAEPPPAPLPPPECPPCGECGRLVATSYLLDTFGHPTCDACRDDDGAHALLTRTEAKSEYLLKDCDLDARSPALRCVRRPNPHRGARSDMRLYLRAQVEERALLVWGSATRLEAEREARGARRAEATRRKETRRLRALRMDVRSSLYARDTAPHDHRWGPETHHAADDTYERACLDCDHTETYEKM